MDLKDNLKVLGDRILKLKEQILTEEATKNAFIMPFIQYLGYDVFNPIEVIPEYICDIGTKKGEKIDYAIFKDGEPILLIECKHWAQDIDLHDNQLLRYFNVSKAKFGVLTNGIVYKIYTDLVQKNIMDEKPFLEIDLTNLKDSHIEELKKFSKTVFDANKIFGTASDLKYTSEIKQLIKQELENPSEQFVRFFAKQVYSGILNQKNLDYFTTLVKRSSSSLINDIINERLKTALKAETEKEEKEEKEAKQATIDQQEQDAPQIETTEEELEGFYTIKTMLREVIPPDRFTYKDSISYFAINLDGNTRKPICRLFFNGKQKYIATIDENRKETKYPIENITDVYEFKQQLADRIAFLDS